MKFKSLQYNIHWKTDNLSTNKGKTFIIIQVLAIIEQTKQNSYHPFWRVMFAYLHHHHRHHNHSKFVLSNDWTNSESQCVWNVSEKFQIPLLNNIAIWDARSTYYDKLFITKFEWKNPNGQKFSRDLKRPSKKKTLTLTWIKINIWKFIGIQRFDHPHHHLFHYYWIISTINEQQTLSEMWNVLQNCYPPEKSMSNSSSSFAVIEWMSMMFSEAKKK